MVVSGSLDRSMAIPSIGRILPNTSAAESSVDTSSACRVICASDFQRRRDYGQRGAVGLDALDVLALLELAPALAAIESP